ncbi:hypothetical protein PRUPE_3G116400 [Prunus persica]|uniref:Uncharacterized protein n=1 Tax=Prunus persica TaxID=3760 RepID=A0A251PYV5_PRUPE|nr:hypothetical protein PRUPE_3G116400 [Prunus persica]
MEVLIWRWRRFKPKPISSHEWEMAAAEPLTQLPTTKALKYLKPDGEEDLLCPKTEHNPKEPMKLTLSPSQDQTKAEPWLFKPKPSSVFPVKKRLVKRIMFDQIVQCFCSVSDYTNSPLFLLLEPLKPSHHQTVTRSLATTFTQAHHHRYGMIFCFCFCFCYCSISVFCF